MSASPDRSRGILDGVLIVGFLAALLLPGVNYLRAHDEAARAVEIRERERRGRLNPAPNLSWNALESLPQAVDDWWPQRIGLRTPLLKLRGRIWWQLLGEAPGERMVRGQDGWMFLSRHDFLPLDRGFLDGWRGASAISSDEARAWIDLFAERQAWLAERGIAHLVVIAPQKASLYPEYMPRNFERVGSTSFERVLAEMRANEFDVLDLRDACQAARADDDPATLDFVYHPSGTHWSARGVAVAYRTILDRLQAQGVSLGEPWSDWAVEPFSDDADSWEDRLYLDGLVPRTRHELLEQNAPALQQTRVPGLRSGHRLARGGAGRSIVLMHDSYGLEVRKLLALHADVTTLRTFEFDEGRIEAARPDVVIELFVERMFDQQDPKVLRRIPTGAEAFDVAPVGTWSRSDLGTVDVDPTGTRFPIDGLPRDLQGPLLKLVLTSPGEGLLSVVPKTFSPDRPGVWDGPAAPVHEGRNEIVLRLPTAAMRSGRFDLWLEGAPGTWTFESGSLREGPVVPESSASD